MLHRLPLILDSAQYRVDRTEDRIQRSLLQAAERVEGRLLRFAGKHPTELGDGREDCERRASAAVT
jgi:hypothetical protein